MTDEVAAFKDRARATWSAGDWDGFSHMISEVGPNLLDKLELEPGLELLDIGTGSGGTVAIPAAQRGAKVTGADLTPDLLEAGRRRAAEAGVEVNFVEGDAEALPFEDATFDRVTSTFGHMFAPRHDVAGAELARVLRPGGMAGTCTWIAGGGVGQMFAILGSRMPPPPDFASPPPLWGDPDHVRQMLEPHGLELEFEENTASLEHDGDAEEFVRYYEENFGPMVMARQGLGEETWGEVRGELVDLFTQENHGDDSHMKVEPPYLITLARKR